MSTAAGPGLVTLDDDLDEDDDLLPRGDAQVEAEIRPENYYPHVYAFVVDFWAPTFAHNVSEQITAWRWCSHWFHHVEAMARLEAWWKAWEVLRRDPGTGASVWVPGPRRTLPGGADGLGRAVLALLRHHPQAAARPAHRPVPRGSVRDPAGSSVPPRPDPGT